MIAAIVTSLLAVLAFLGIRQYTDLFVTAKIDSLKLGKGEDINSPETSTFTSSERLHAVVKFFSIDERCEIEARILFDDVEGHESGTVVPGSEKTWEPKANGGSVIFWYSINDWSKGKYKFEFTLMDSSDQQKDKKIVRFRVLGKALDPLTPVDRKKAGH